MVDFSIVFCVRLPGRVGWGRPPSPWIQAVRVAPTMPLEELRRDHIEGWGVVGVGGSPQGIHQK